MTCEHCGRPITTREHAATMTGGPQLLEKADEVCDGCKLRGSAERLRPLGG